MLEKKIKKAVGQDINDFKTSLEIESMRIRSKDG